MEPVEYELTLDDLVAFNYYHVTHSPAMRRQLWMGRWLVVTLLAAIAVAVEWATGFIGICIPIGLFCAIYVIGFPRFHRKAQEKLARKLYAEGSQRNMVGRKCLKIESGELIIASDSETLRTALVHIDRVVNTGQLILIYTGSMNAHVIPTRCQPGHSSSGSPRDLASQPHCSSARF